MARYVDDYRGISAHEERPRGLDPNYRGGYRGERMRGGPGQAEYGRYRMSHRDELGGENGAFGMYPGRGMYADDYESSYDQPGHRGYEPGRHGGGGSDRGGYDRGWQGGGVRDLRHSPEALREFNANSMAFRRYGHDLDHREQRGRYDQSMFGHDREWRFGYGNRGMSSGGYSEGWAWGPMRGAR